MQIGIITVRDGSYHPNGRLMEAAAARGHRAELIHPYRLWPWIDSRGLGCQGEPDPQSLDVVLPRQGATIGDSSLALLHHLGCMGLPLVNDADAVRLSRSQILTLQALATRKLPVPETLFVNSPAGFDRAVVLLGGYPVVVKQVSGRQGTGIRLVEDSARAQAVIANELDRRAGILVQRFIPPANRRDIRVMVVAGRIAGAMEMKPRQGDFRANFHLTGESRAVRLARGHEKLALEATGATGLDIAGVDMIVDGHGRSYIVEVNYSPGFKGLEKATGLDIAGCMIDCAAAKSGAREAGKIKKTNTKH
ncbi:MAG: RimK family alpha-L-glutamate ligase [Deltaproteobacteria bacterium]|nr:RimK family alpha-L-glutamate ligase [Deltaproteobacteria bacterium]